MPPTARSFSARARRRSTARTATPRETCSSRSFDPDPHPVAEQLPPGTVAEHPIRGLAEALESLADLSSTGELGWPADALGQSDRPFGIGLAPATGDQFAGVAKAAAGTNLVEMPLFRPARCTGWHFQPVPLLPTSLHEVGEGRVDLGFREGRDVVVASREDSSDPQDPRSLGEHRLRLHPVE